MYLSKLELIGFKSFANRTLLKFDSGMTSIVGPNGCGKTNVVDAIRWALGEQKAGTLRSDVMENVIFNGSRTRKPLGMSEVSLTIENTKGILPTEYSEVTITRRLFRSGESEYLLNKAQCRLKDIVELFMDTGMGANAYSVIELKMIETILSDRTEERRKLFEEAAGVTKYKARRKEALRRLDQVTADLEKIDSIIKEVTKNVASLERQAEKAERYNDLSGKLRISEIDLMEREYSVSRNKLIPLRNVLKEQEESRSHLATELAKFESLIDLISKEEQEIEDQLRISERTLKEKNETFGRLRETIVGTEERIISLSTQFEGAQKDIERLEADGKTLGETLYQHASAVSKLQTDSEALINQRGVASATYNTARSVLDVKHSGFQTAQREVSSLLEERDELSSGAAQARARLEELARRSDQLSTEEDRLNRHRNELKEKETSCSIDHENALRVLADSEQVRREAQQKRESLKLAIDSLQTKSFGLQKEIGQHLSKIEFLTSLVERSLGTGEGAEFLMKNHSWSKSGGPITVLDAINTTSDYRVAIENALGEAGQYFIATTRDEAMNAIESLRHSQKGKATFICLDEIPTSSAHAVEHSALSVTTFDRKYENLYKILLSATATSSTLGEAFGLLRSNSAIDKVVTLDGEVVTRSGILRGGSKKNSEGSLIGKQQQIIELEKKASTLKEQVEKIDIEIQQANSEYEKIGLKDFEQQLQESQQVFRNAERQLEQLTYELKRTAEQLESIAKERQELAVRNAEQTRQLEEIAPALEELEEKYQNANQLLIQAQSEVQSAERTLSAASEAFTSAQVRAAEAQSVLDRTRSEILRLEGEIAAGEALLDEKRSDCQRFMTEKTSNEGKIVELQAMLATLESEIGLSETQHRAVLDQKKEKQTLAQKYRDGLREQRQEHEKTISATHELELKIQEIESKITNILLRSKEEFQLEELEMKDYPEDDPFSFGEAREAIQQLKQSIRNLGNVNQLAYEEFARERERMEFLTTQRKDLADAQSTLLETIDEINTTATTKFLETFAQVQIYFQDIFRSLFTEGDECELKLEEGDPLEAQIEIIARPRGKKPHGIESLSGGEKTMTAIALLFAIYLVKPSPFCILDEVDAPLDDANIDRFLQLVKRFTKETQFIVVTHNKRTMAAADALYGVTQEEDGVSKIVSVRLRKEQQLAAAA
ncbi:MAG: chromosome segregation protein SMC [Candidatus Kapaibacterium sp.]